MPFDPSRLDKVMQAKCVAKLKRLDKALAAKARSIVHVRTGRLKASIKPLPIAVSIDRIEGGIVADTPYALREELLHHPFMGVALAEAEAIWLDRSSLGAEPEEESI